MSKPDDIIDPFIDDIIYPFIVDPLIVGQTAKALYLSTAASALQAGTNAMLSASNALSTSLLNSVNQNYNTAVVDLATTAASAFKILSGPPSPPKPQPLPPQPRAREDITDTYNTDSYNVDIRTTPPGAPVVT